MCGIAGLLGSPDFIEKGGISSINQQLVHRGPDDDGVWTYRCAEGALAFGHRRLAILDLSPAGHQPMVSEDGKFALVFNGEIYNFGTLAADLRSKGVVFRGHSDTEVLLQGLICHGEAFIKKLQGMYAFAFFNSQTNDLLLARDPAGIKPLYVYNSINGTAFSSEIRPLLRLIPNSLDLDYESIRSYLAYGAVQQPSTLYRSVRMVNAGTFEKYRLHSNQCVLKETKVFWAYPTESVVCSEVDAVEKTSELLSSAVKDHLISDVPVGVFLSAGVDSTLLTALARRFSNTIAAYTIELEGAGADEGAIAAETANRLDVKHTSIKVSDSEAKTQMQAWLECIDSPSIDGLNTFVISHAVRSQGIKVALSGVGADELFGGYSSFRDNPKIEKIAKSIRLLPKSFRRKIAHIVRYNGTAEAREKLADMLVGGRDVLSLAFLRRRLFSDKILDSLLSADRFSEVNGHRDKKHIIEKKLFGDLVTQSGWATGYAEFMGYQKNMLLRDSDAASMAHSLEIRVPYLDQRIIDWVPRLPDDIRFPRKKSEKYLLKRAFESELSQAQIVRPKTGFELPFVKWMHGPLRELCRANLDTLNSEGFLNRSVVESIWDHFVSKPYTGSASRALSLVSLGASLRLARNYA